MSLTTELSARAGGQCELCAATGADVPFSVGPDSAEAIDTSVLLCSTCQSQLDGSEPLTTDHWRSLTDTMWSQVPAVQVMIWRTLRRIRHEGWASEALDMLYLDDDVRVWAESGEQDPEPDLTGSLVHRDGNGAVLSAGDTVTLIKDLNVKGAGFTAKRGTAVRGISLVQDNAGHIEGRINGQQVVILTEFVKKSG